MTNEKLFAKATQVAIENMRENEQLRTIMFLEGCSKNALFRVEYYVDGQDDYRVLEVRVEIKSLSYKEQLEMAETMGIEPTELKIAQEINSCETFEDENEYLFNKACNLVSETYYDIDDCNSIAYCSMAIASLFEYGYTLEHIEDMLPRERFEKYEELC